VLLAELVLVMVSTSVGNERIQYKIFEKSPGALKQEHLTACARGFKSKLSVGSSPIQRPVGRGWMRTQSMGARAEVNGGSA